MVLGHELIPVLELYPSGYQPLFSRMYHWIYSFHMMLFFTISGLLFFKAYCGENGRDSKRKGRFSRQLINLIWAYFLFSGVYWGGHFFFSFYMRTPATVKELMLIPLVPIQMYWYLWVLVAYYLIGYLLFHVVFRRIRVPDAAWATAALALSLSSSFIPFPGILKQVAYYAAGFFFGAFLGKNGLGILKKRLTAAIAVSVAVFVSGMIFAAEWRPLTMPAGNTLIALAFSVAFLCVFMRLYENAGETAGPLRRGLAELGGYALEIYVLHWAPIVMNRRICAALGIVRNLPGVLISTAVSVAVPVCCAWLLKKIHLHAPVFRPATWIYERSMRKSPG